LARLVGKRIGDLVESAVTPALHGIVHRAIMPSIEPGETPTFGELASRLQKASNAVHVRRTVCFANSRYGRRDEMRKIGMALAIAAALAGSVSTAQTAYAAQTPQGPHVYTQPADPLGPEVQMFDCQGTTGPMGCGPGWFWRDGWRGWGCYPC
jgi:hypothetical protein